MGHIMEKATCIHTPASAPRELPALKRLRSALVPLEKLYLHIDTSGKKSLKYCFFYLGFLIGPTGGTRC